MKVTNADVIKTGEQELIDAITADLDWSVIEDIFRKEHNLGLEEEIEYKKGDIVAYDNQILYRLEFEVKVNLAVLLNRKGEYISISISDDENPETKDRNENTPNESDKTEQNMEDEQKDNSLADEDALKNDEELKSVDKKENKENDEFDAALKELDSMDAPKDSNSKKRKSSDDGSKGKISQMASQASEIMEEIG